jgi:hypothetical protein
MGRWWRWAVGGLVMAILALGAPTGQPETVEAMSQARARINWTPAIPYPSHLRDWQTFQDEHSSELRERTLVLFRDATFTRRTNSDADAAASGLVYRVTDEDTFQDDFLFTPTIDLQDAWIYVHQPVWGPTQCQVLVYKIEDRDGNNVVTPPAGRAAVDLGPLTTAMAPYKVTVQSRIPRQSQQPGGRATPRILTSVVRILERAPSRATPRAGQPSPTATPTPQPCDVPVGPPGFHSLNRALIIRTELDGTAWAAANGRPAPTPIAIR